MTEPRWKKFTVEEKPAYALADFLELHAWRFDDEESSDLPAFAERLKEEFYTALTLCDEKQLAFVRAAALMSADKKPFVGEMPGEYYAFYFNGFMFLFSWEDRDYLVLPDELRGIYDRALADADFAAKSGRNQELGKYARGLLHLYGAYEIEWFVEVWNRHHHEKITTEEAEQFLADLEYFDADYYFSEGFIVHE